MSSIQDPALDPRFASPGLFLDSDLWLDQPEAEERIAERLAAGEIDGEAAERLRHFAERGCIEVDLGTEEALLDGLVAGVERLWQERPADVAYASGGPPRPFSDADEARDRKPRYRIHDPHSHVEEALALYLEPQVFDFLQLVAGREVVAIQSLYFEYGSQQILHRDTMVLPTGAPLHLFGCWIALEDIGPDCGALAYVPGSHRLPYFELAPGEHQWDARRMGEEEIRVGTAFDDEQCRRHGLETRLFTARKGEALIWHGSLRHGGGPVRDPRLTRKSFVVHFSLRETYEARSITVHDRVTGADGEVADRPRVMETRELLERGGRRGYDNPMRGYAVGAG